MLTLPPELVGEILTQVNRVDLPSTLKVSTLWHDLTLEQIKPIKTKKEYRKAAKQGDVLSLYYAEYVDCNKGLFGACRGGHREIAELMIKKGAGHLDLGLYHACKGGHRNIVDLMIEHGANCNRGLYGACLGGHRELVDLMIEKGADRWDRGLQGACKGGHRKLVDLMIEKGADD